MHDCKHCRRPVPANERVAYGSFCESCWTLGCPGQCPASPPSNERPPPDRTRRRGRPRNEDRDRLRELLGIA
jgi:hypothetical protein